MTARRAALLAALATSIATVSCKRTPPATVDEAGTPAAPSDPTAPSDPSAPVAMVDAGLKELPPVENLPPTYTEDGGSTVTPGKFTPTPIDPFEAPMASVRTSAVPCFAPLPPGEYSATLLVVVTPVGRVTRVEVSTAVTDDKVIACLKEAATRSYPSSTDGRKLSITIKVNG